MKLIKYILILGGLLAAAACSDLELNESVYHTKTYQFRDFKSVKEVMTNVYGYLENGFSDCEGTMREAVTDNAIYGRIVDPLYTFYNGSWSSTNLIDDKWWYYYEAIRAANYFLENCPEGFPEAQYIDNYANHNKQLQNYPWEAKALRAYFHFELLKRFGKIIIADRCFSKEEVNDLIPADSQTVAAWIVTELDECIAKLPESYLEGDFKYFAERGRVTKGFAMALKSRVTLYAASPLFNASNDKKLYSKAAAAANDFIKTKFKNPYLLIKPAINGVESKDLIFGMISQASSSFEAANFPIGFEGGNTGVCPSLNLVEAYEDGDIRRSETIYANGDPFKGSTIESYTGGKNGQPLANASPTSFYLRKFIRENTSFDSGASKFYEHVFPLFRYAEIYLNYAEALFEATGNPNFTGTLDGVNYTTSPVSALNKVRSLSISGSSINASISEDEFRAVLRNERRVEFAFEDHRYWDVRRWKILPQTREIRGLSIERTLISDMGTPETTDDIASYTETANVIRTYNWTDKHYFFPIPEAEIRKNPNLSNIGW